ncbi:MAG: threonine synthase [Clostridia bacterium]
MNFYSTEDVTKKVSFSEALTQGISSEGGLFVPEELPKISSEEIESMLEMSYDERANLILGKFATDFSAEEIAECTKKAYSRFDGEPAPLVKIDDGIYLLELFHGPTLAFKDIALTLFPNMLAKAREKVGMKEEVLILVATSGDTGKAALEGFKDIDGIKILVFYPNDGVSNMQKLQMTTQKGSNVGVAAIEGNFDNCQSGVKEIFGDKAFEAEILKRGYKFSSANSINLGRLLPQVVYYFSSYLDLVYDEEIQMGDEVNFTVPTGNFGNILAGYYAKKMGLPVKKFICASNSNNVLTEFFNTGRYDAKRNFYKTMSPSMDILISSNLERLLFLVSGNDDKLTKERMQTLKATGEFKVTTKELDELNEFIYAGAASEDDTAKTISLFYEEYGYALDPHTAVGVYAQDEYAVQQNDFTNMIVISTASPYKFNQDVLKAIGGKINDNAFKNLKTLNSLTAVDIPEALANLEFEDVRFKNVYEVSQMKQSVQDFLDGKIG